MKYKIGDKVKINLDSTRHYTGLTVIDGMLKFNGQVCTIKALSPAGWYKLEKIGFSWSDEMLIPASLTTVPTNTGFYIISEFDLPSFERKLAKALDSGLVLTNTPIHFPTDRYNAVLKRPTKI